MDNQNPNQPDEEDEEENQGLNEPDRDQGPNEPDRGEEPLSINPIENNNDPEEEEEDFPDYANEQNKQLNQIVININPNHIIYILLNLNRSKKNEN